MKVRRRTALRRIVSLAAVMVVATLAVMGVTSTVAMAAGAMASATSYEATTEDGVKVSVGAPQGALPDGATLHVDPVTSDEDVQAVTDELDGAEVSYDGFAAFDVYFTDADGNEVEPTEAVSVRFELPEGAVPEGAEDLAVHHLAEAEDGTVAEVEAVADDADATEGTVAVKDDATVDAEFTVGDLSVLAFSWAENAGENVAETTAAAEVTSTSSSATHATTGTNLLTETFTGSSVADPDSWLRFGTAGLTAASKGSEWYVGNYTDGTGSYLNGDHGDGYLQLTDASGGDTGTVLYNQPVQSRLGLDISFYQWQFEGSTNPPADGIGFFLTDGSYDLSKQGPQGDGCGGALGYSAIENNGDEDNVEPGIEHGVLGIGLDVFGNFSATNQVGGNDNRDKSNQDGSDSHQYSVTVRGAGKTDSSGNWVNGYERLAYKSLSYGERGYLQTSAPSQTGHGNNKKNVPGQANGVLVNIHITPVEDDGYQYLTVKLTDDDGKSITPIENLKLSEKLPDLVKFGFSASTGANTDAHYIRGLEASTVLPVESGIFLTKEVNHDTSNGGTSKEIFNVGDEVPYMFVVQNTGGSKLTNVTVTDPHISNITLNNFDLEIGEQVTCYGTYTLKNEDIVTPEGSTTGTFTNVATVVGTDAEGKQVTDTDDAVITTVPNEEIDPPAISKKIGDNNDGTYTLALDVIGNSNEGVIEGQGEPLDIVLVLDVSGSMADYSYKSVYNLETGSTRPSYYVYVTSFVGGEYHELQHDWRGWYYTGTFGGHEYVTPKTSPNSNGTQVYERSSTTKLEALKSAVDGFITATAENNAGLDAAKQSRIALVKFADDSYNYQIGNDHTDWHGYNYTQVVSDFTTDSSQLQQRINALDAAGATAADYGLTMAGRVLSGEGSNLAGARDEAQKVVIFFTDGEPNHENGFDGTVADSAISAANTLKDSAVVYSIGVFEDADPSDTTGNFNAYMHGVSSNFPDALSYTNLGNRAQNSDFYKGGSSADDLGSIFEGISEDINVGTSYSAVSIVDQLSEYAEITDAITYDDASGEDGFHRVTAGVSLKVERPNDEGWEEVQEDVPYTAYYMPSDSADSTGTIKVVFGADYKLKKDFKYTVMFDVKPTDKANEDYASNVAAGGNGYGGTVGDEGTDLNDRVTSSLQPGFHSNHDAWVEYTAYDKPQEPVYYHHPVLQVKTLTVTGKLSVTKTLNGHDLEPNMFGFTVTPVAPIDESSSAKESADFAGFKWDESAQDHGISFNNGTHEGAANDKVTIRDGNTLVIDPSDAGKSGKTYAYEYRESDGLLSGITDVKNGQITFDSNVYRVEVKVENTTDEGLKATITKYVEDKSAENGWRQLDQLSLSQKNPAGDKTISIDFANKYNGYGLNIYKFIWDDKDKDGVVDEGEDIGPRSGATFEVAPVNPSEASLGSVETDYEGNADFTGLMEGAVYKVEETRVPSGYDLAAPRYIRIDDGKAYMVEQNENGEWVHVVVNGKDSELPTVSDNDSIFQIKIGNKETPDLPSSGSNGTLLMMSTGVAVVLLAGAYLSKRFGRLWN